MTQKTLRAPAPNKYSAEASERLVAMVGVDPRTTLDMLRDAQRETTVLRGKEAKIAAKLAMHEARFGYPSHFEHERKAMLARLSSHERDRVRSQGKKVTESELEDYAHAHGEYRSFLDEARRQREEMERLRAELIEVRGEIETAKGVETYFERHARLNDGLIWQAGKEMSL